MIMPDGHRPLGGPTRLRSASPVSCRRASFRSATRCGDAKRIVNVHTVVENIEQIDVLSNGRTAKTADVVWYKSGNLDQHWRVMSMSTRLDHLSLLLEV